MDHHEFSDTGVIGNPFRATAEKGEQAFQLYSDHLVDAIAELLKVPWKSTTASLSRGPSGSGSVILLGAGPV